MQIKNRVSCGAKAKRDFEARQLAGKNGSVWPIIADIMANDRRAYTEAAQQAPKNKSNTERWEGNARELA
jgi:hypothetical protein